MANTPSPAPGMADWRTSRPGGTVFIALLGSPLFWVRTWQIPGPPLSLPGTYQIKDGRLMGQGGPGIISLLSFIWWVAGRDRGWWGGGQVSLVCCLLSGGYLAGTGDQVSLVCRLLSGKYLAGTGGDQVSLVCRLLSGEYLAGTGIINLLSSICWAAGRDGGGRYH